MKRMRIILQQRNGSLYFKDIGSWTADPAEAMDFVSSADVLEFCMLNKIDGVQVVLKFEDEKYEIVLPEAIPPHYAGERAQPST
jgi:hypothetical protein